MHTGGWPLGESPSWPSSVVVRPDGEWLLRVSLSWPLVHVAVVVVAVMVPLLAHRWVAAGGVAQLAVRVKDGEGVSPWGRWDLVVE